MSKEVLEIIESFDLAPSVINDIKKRTKNTLASTSLHDYSCYMDGVKLFMKPKDTKKIKLLLDEMMVVMFPDRYKKEAKSE